MIQIAEPGLIVSFGRKTIIITTIVINFLLIKIQITIGEIEIKFPYFCCNILRNKTTSP